MSTSYDISTSMMMVVLLELHCSFCKPSGIEARAMCSCTVTLVQSEVYIRQDIAHNSKMFHVLWQNVCSAEFLLDYIELMYHLVIYTIIMTLPRHRPVVRRFNLWVGATEGLRPILLRWLSGSFRGTSAGDAKSKRGDIPCPCACQATSRDEPHNNMIAMSNLKLYNAIQ
jgi:hypothetical protein